MAFLRQGEYLSLHRVNPIVAKSLIAGAVSPARQVRGVSREAEASRRDSRRGRNHIMSHRRMADFRNFLCQLYYGQYPAMTPFVHGQGGERYDE
jgi:hypothetical protein